MEKKEQLYDIQEYSEEELYDILDLDDPSDRELEAKISKIEAGKKSTLNNF